MNDPYRTMHLPVTEFSSESRGTSFPPDGTINPPKDTTPIPPKGTTGYSLPDTEPPRFEQTVFGAVGRYRFMVVAVAVLVTAIAVGYSLGQPKVYRAQANITVPQQVSLQGQQVDSGQYLDSQVISLQSQTVAQLAVSIANAELHSQSLSLADFYGSRSSLEITPPLAADVPGAYGATVIGVSFAASTAQVAQVGTNAVIQAYNKTRTATIQSQDNAAITGIDNAINSTNRQLAQLSAQGSSSGPDASNLEQQLLAQRAALINQRAQVIANEQTDLAQQAAVASEPAIVTNHKYALDGGIGLIIGILIGGALAFVRARRRRSTVARSGDSSRKHGVQPSPASEYRTATTTSSQRPRRV